MDAGDGRRRWTDADEHRRNETDAGDRQTQEMDAGDGQTHNTTHLKELKEGKGLRRGKRELTSRRGGIE